MELSGSRGLVGSLVSLNMFFLAVWIYGSDMSLVWMRASLGLIMDLFMQFFSVGRYLDVMVDDIDRKRDEVPLL